MKEKIHEIFGQHFDTEPIIVCSPGHINIIGEHTDYNNGFVLPVAIDKAAYVAMQLSGDDEIHLVAQDLNEKFSIRISDMKPVG